MLLGRIKARTFSVKIHFILPSQRIACYPPFTEKNYDDVIIRNKDEEFETFRDLREYRMGDYTKWLRGLLSHFDRQMLFPFVFLVNAGP